MREIHLRLLMAVSGIGMEALGKDRAEHAALITQAWWVQQGHASESGGGRLNALHDGAGEGLRR